jgi:hypothetical protein
MLLTTGLIDSLSLWILICAFRVGDCGLICVRYFFCCLSIIALHLRMICCICFWYLSVGSFSNCVKWLSVKKSSTFCVYVFLFMMTIVLPLSAFVMISCSVLILYVSV